MLHSEIQYFVYAISSINRDYIYVGISDDVHRRFTQHNNGYEKTTKPYRPFRLIHTEIHKTRADARKREQFLKSGYKKQFDVSYEEGLR